MDWRSVQLAHDQWQYKQQGLTPAGAALVAVAVAWAAGPAGAGLLGTSTTPAGLMLDAALGSLATQASITLINNRGNIGNIGNIGNTLKELGSSQVVRATITAALTAGVLDKIGALNSMKALADSTAWQDQLTVNLVNASGQSLTNAAINGGKLGDALREALTTGLVNQVHGMAASRIKGLEEYYVAHKLAHALAGCGAGAAVGGRCADGAIGAAVGEMVAELQDKPGATAGEQEWQAYRANTLALSKITAGAITAYAGGNAQTAINSAETAVRYNFLYEVEARSLDKELAACKASGGDCTAVIEKYIEKSNENSRKLAESCNKGGVGCVTWEELIRANTNVANDAHPWQIRWGEKLKDPDAAALVNYLNGKDLQFLKENITTGDRFLAAVIDPFSWPVIVMGAKSIITGTGIKEQLIAAGVSSGANAAIQYGTTGEVKLSDVIGSGVIGAITAGKGYNPTVIWNAVGGYYSAEIKGDDPFMAALLSKAGASVGYATGNIIKVPMERVLNPVSKQYEWTPTGVWTITKPAPTNPLPSIAGNIGDSAISGMTQDKLQSALRKSNEK